MRINEAKKMKYTREKLMKYTMLYEKYSNEYKLKEQSKATHLQEKKTSLVTNFVGNHLVQYVVNNPDLKSAQVLTYEAELKQKAEKKFQAYKDMYNESFKEETKPLIKKIMHTYTTILQLKNELKLTTQHDKQQSKDESMATIIKPIDNNNEQQQQL